MTEATSSRYFTTYTGVTLPFRFVDELTRRETQNRNTFFVVDFDALDRPTCFRKMVRGEVEMAHRYAYHGDGSALAEAEITDCEGDVVVLRFGEDGRPTPDVP